MSTPIQSDDCIEYIVLIDTGSIGMVPRGTHPGIGDTVTVEWLDDDGIKKKDTGILVSYIQVF